MDSMIKNVRNSIKKPRAAARFIRTRVPEAVRLISCHSIGVGNNVFNKDWDLLIILDSCRVDALKEVAENYEFLYRNQIQSEKSVGGSTLEWSAATFTKKYQDVLENTALISGNPWPYRIIEEEYTINDFVTPDWGTVSPDTLGLNKRAWKYKQREVDDRPYGDSSVVTDMSIQTGRESEFDRVVAHYIEPHYPYVAAAQARGATSLDETEQKPWEYLKAGGNHNAVWENYLTELRAGLDEVSILLDNFDADTVLITADHGEAFGEYGKYGHSSGSLHPEVRTVPVVQTSATDNKTRNVNEYEIDTETKAKDRLRDLGYL